MAAALVVAGVAAAFAIAWRPAISAIDPPSPQSFDGALVKRGRELAAIGNCGSCHTLRGGMDFAGGLPVPTPFGTIYSSNITPDAETGIGRWPEAAFRRAMRSGVDRSGRHLYPTFPYDHFTNVSDEDDRALYAYLMTRAAGRRTRPRQPAVLSARSALCDCGLEIAVPSRRDLPAGSARKARNGIAAPIWSRGSRIAAPAIRRAMRSARSAPAQAVRRRRGRRLVRLRDQRAISGAGAVERGRAVHLSALRLARRPRRRARADGAGRRAICRRCRTTTSARSRPMSPA